MSRSASPHEERGAPLRTARTIFSVEVGSQWKPSQLRPTLDVAVLDPGVDATAVAVLSVDGLVRHQDSMPDRSGKNRSAKAHHPACSLTGGPA
jgi:hypothetical protein